MPRFQQIELDSSRKKYVLSSLIGHRFNVRNRAIPKLCILVNNLGVQTYPFLVVRLPWD